MEFHPLPPESLEHERRYLDERRRLATEAGVVQPDEASDIHGLALSGGGIRAAFIARGLLEGLHRVKLFARFDYMSSVSGGGYAAAGVADQAARDPSGPLFADADSALSAPPYALGSFLAALVLDLLFQCVPLFGFIGLLLLGVVSGRAGDEATLFGVCLALACLLGAWIFMLRRVRYVTEHFDVGAHFLLTGLGFVAGASWTVNFGALPAAAALLLGMALSGSYVAARPHRYYRTTNPFFRLFFSALLGVAGTQLVLFAHRWPWADRSVLALGLAWVVLPWNWSLSWQNRVHFVFRAYRHTLRKRFMPQSAASCKLHELPPSWRPYPIFNACANLGPRLASFELTAHHCGSPETGYETTREHLPGLDLADAMAISGGAVDFLRKTATLSSLAGTLFGGTSYWTGYPRRRGLVMPIALERLSTLAGAEPRAAIQLSDGGFVENLGVLALARRQADLIVCLDAGYDPEFAFDDLRRLCVTLQTQGLARLALPDIGTASERFRFRQNMSSILEGRIDYLDASGRIVKKGRYLHIKINGALVRMQGMFADFPHLTTMDQRLTDEEIGWLHALGDALAGELSRDPRFNPHLRG